MCRATPLAPADAPLKVCLDGQHDVRRDSDRPSPRLDIPRSYLSRGFGRFVGEKVGELFGEAVGGATS